MNSVSFWQPAVSSTPGLVVIGPIARALAYGRRSEWTSRQGLRLGAELRQWLLPGVRTMRAEEEAFAGALVELVSWTCRRPGLVEVAVSVWVRRDRLVGFRVTAASPRGRLKVLLLRTGGRCVGAGFREFALLGRRAGERCFRCGSPDRDQCRCPCWCCGRQIDECRFNLEIVAPNEAGRSGGAL